jgi:pimeloyl-ACP methyl ester carboxylesterase
MVSSSGLAEINGAQLHYETRGDGPPLLLIHAGVADSRMWHDQIDAFSQAYWVIRFDLRGFGRSDMPPGSFANYEDVRALLDHLDIESAHVLGISFGGAVALDFCLAYPDRVRSLILGAPSVGGTEPSERIRRFWQEEDEALEAGDLDAATELNLRLWVDGPERTPEQVEPRLREKVRQMQLAIFQKEIPDDIEEIDLEPPAAQRLPEIAAPTLILVGQLDLDEKRDLAGRLAAEIPGARKVVLPGVAHMLNMERPEQFNQHVLDFLDGIVAT